MRLLRFNGVSLGGLAITTLLLTLLTSYSGLHLLLANLLAIGGAMTWNYVVNSRWTWGDKSEVASRTSQDPASIPVTCDLPPATGEVGELTT
jgi:putative flippase GtrA